MTKLRLTKTWRIIVIVAAIVLAFYLIVYLIFLPRFTVWLRSKYPEAFAVQQTLETHFPQKKIGVNDQTFYIEAGQHSKEHILIVSVAGKSYLSPGEEASAKSDTCSALGSNAEKYNRIILQNTVEHRFLVFYSRQYQTESFNCH